jgi:ketosteroid isomerase-like protein
MRKNRTSLPRRLMLATALTCALPAPMAFADTPTPFDTFAPTVPAGDANFNVADRAAISNVIRAYALAYDTFNADAWFDLFTADAVFAAGVPGTAPIVQSGDDFHKFWRDRLATFKTSGDQRRHLMTNITFLGQTDSTAHVSVLGLLTNVADGKTFNAVTSLNYEGWFEKIDGVWKIKEWHDFPDSDPQGAPSN